MWAIPAATVQNTTGAITILTRLIKMSPSGLRATPTSGHSMPTMVPRMIPMITCI